MVSNYNNQVEIFMFISKYIKDKFPMYCIGKSDNDLMNFASVIYSKLRVVDGLNKICSYTNGEILNGDAWLFIDIEVEKKLKEMGISNRFSNVLESFGVKVQRTEVLNIEFQGLEEDDVKKIKDITGLDVLSIQSNGISKEDEKIIMQLDFSDDKFNGLPVNVVEAIKKIIKEYMELRQSDRLEQLGQLREIVLSDNSFSLFECSDDFFERALNSTLYEYREQLKFDGDSDFFRQDFLNKFRLHFNGDFSKKIISGCLNTAERIFDEKFKYSNKVKQYVFNFLSNRVLKNYRFGDDPNNVVSEEFINQPIDAIKKKIKQYLSNDNSLSDDVLDSIINKIMTDEDKLLESILNGKVDDELSKHLQKLVDKCKGTRKVISFVNPNSDKSDDVVRKYIEDYIKKNLKRNDVVSLDDCVDYILTSGKYRLDVIDTFIEESCVKYYIKQYLEKKGLNSSDEIVELIFDSIESSDYFATFNGARDYKIDYLYKLIILRNIIISYFKNNNLDVSDEIIAYITVRIAGLNDSAVQRYGGYDNIIKNLYKRILDVKEYIRKYLHRNNLEESSENIDYIFDCFCCDGYALKSILAGKHDNLIDVYVMKKKSVNENANKHHQDGKKIPRYIVLLLILSLLLPAATVYQVGGEMVDAKDEFFDEVYEAPKRDEEDEEEFFENNDSCLDAIIECFYKLSNCGNDYWMLVFSEAEKVLDEQEMDKLVSALLNHPNVPNKIKSMFIVENKYGEKIQIPVYGSWKLNCLLSSEQRFPLLYESDYLSGEIIQYYYAHNPSSTGTLVPMEHVDMQSLGVLNDLYEQLVEKKDKDFGAYLVLVDGRFSQFIPDWFEDKLKEHFGVSSDGPGRGGN